MTRYKALHAWCRIMKTTDAYRLIMEGRAASQGAPDDAIFYSDYHETWRTVRDIRNPQLLAQLREQGIPTPHADEWDKVADPRSPEEWISFLCGTRCKAVVGLVRITPDRTISVRIPHSVAIELIEDHGDNLYIKLDRFNRVHIGVPVENIP